MIITFYRFSILSQFFFSVIYKWISYCLYSQIEDECTKAQWQSSVNEKKLLIADSYKKSLNSLILLSNNLLNEQNKCKEDLVFVPLTVLRCIHSIHCEFNISLFSLYLWPCSKYFIWCADSHCWIEWRKWSLKDAAKRHWEITISTHWTFCFFMNYHLFAITMCMLCRRWIRVSEQWACGKWATFHRLTHMIYMSGMDIKSGIDHIIQANTW